MEEEFIYLNRGENRWYSGWVKWCPTSSELLQAAETRILKRLKIPQRSQYVTTSQNGKIRAVSFNPDSKKMPMFMVHGFGAGLGIWALNVQELAKDRPVHTFDLLGFARSSRPKFDNDPEMVEKTFVDSIEETRKALGIEKFVMVGHSFGAYLAYSYSIQHPQHIKYLILADPWGFSEKPTDWEKLVNIPTWLKVIATVLKPFNPFSGLRFAGPLGPRVLRRIRGDLEPKFSSLFNDDTILNYIYHCNAQTPSGESAFKQLVLPYGWAKNPMIHRLKDLHSSVKVMVLLGGHSWINNTMLEEAVEEMPEQFEVCTIKSAGHHIYADEPLFFNRLVSDKLEIVDNMQTTDDINLDVE